MRDHVGMNEIISAGPTALVLTALPEEMTAVLAHIKDRASKMIDPLLCEVGRFDASNGLSWQVVAADVGPGSVDTATAVVKLTAVLHPDVLMFVGADEVESPTHLRKNLTNSDLLVRRKRAESALCQDLRVPQQSDERAPKLMRYLRLPR